MDKTAEIRRLQKVRAKALDIDDRETQRQCDFQISQLRKEIAAQAEQEAKIQRQSGILVVDDEVEHKTCLVCDDSKAETINNLLQEGESLRKIESQFHLSRSTLSRHNRLCLNHKQTLNHSNKRESPIIQFAIEELSQTLNAIYKKGYSRGWQDSELVYNATTKKLLQKVKAKNELIQRLRIENAHLLCGHSVR